MLNSTGNVCTTRICKDERVEDTKTSRLSVGDNSIFTWIIRHRKHDSSPENIKLIVFMYCIISHSNDGSFVCHFNKL